MTHEDLAVSPQKAVHSSAITNKLPPTRAVTDRRPNTSLAAIQPMSAGQNTPLRARIAVQFYSRLASESGPARQGQNRPQQVVKVSGSQCSDLWFGGSIAQWLRKASGNALVFVL